jgi:riboflavin transporter FmnP
LAALPQQTITLALILAALPQQTITLALILAALHQQTITLALILAALPLAHIVALLPKRESNIIFTYRRIAVGVSFQLLKIAVVSVVLTLLYGKFSETAVSTEDNDILRGISVSCDNDEALH